MFLKINEVMAVSGFDQKELNALMIRKVFPLPVKDVEGEIAWVEEEVTKAPKKGEITIYPPKKRRKA